MGITMTLAVQVASVVSAVVALLTALRWFIHIRMGYVSLRWSLRVARASARMYEEMVRLIGDDPPRRRSVPLGVPVWALILFEPEEAERWSREVESHIWELLERHAVRQARRDRRKLIARGLLLAVALRVTKRFNRARPH
jgi:hypothetical protein